MPGGPPSGPNNQSNVSAVLHAGRLLSSGEVGLPFAVDPSDLSTLGAFDFDGELTQSFTAHPKIDPATGYLHFFGYWFLGEDLLLYHVADEAGNLISTERVPVAASTMIHSFAITDQDVVFWEAPVLFDLDAAIAGEAIPFKWDASYGARIGVMPLGGPVADIRWVEVDPFYVFHEVNAYRSGDEVVVDVCWHPDMFSGSDLIGGSRGGLVKRWRIQTAGAEPPIARRSLRNVCSNCPATIVASRGDRTGMAGSPIRATTRTPSISQASATSTIKPGPSPRGIPVSRVTLVRRSSSREM